MFLLVASVAVVPAAQDVPLTIDTPVPGTDSYDQSIPTPTEVIGHEIGTRHTRSAQAVRYFEAVAEASDRVVLREHGRTYEGRRLIHAIVTDPSNQDNLEQIRQANRRATTAPGRVSDADLEKRELDVDSLVQNQSYEDLPNAYGAQGIGGSIFEAEVDPTHPVAYGYDETVPVFRLGTGFYGPSDEPGASVGTYDAESPRLSGYLSDDQRKQAQGAASIEAHEVGGGQVILFMDNPNFRAFWYGTNGLFLNAVYFGQIL